MHELDSAPSPALTALRCPSCQGFITSALTTSDEGRAQLAQEGMHCPHCERHLMLVTGDRRFRHGVKLGVGMAIFSLVGVGMCASYLGALAVLLALSQGEMAIDTIPWSGAITGLISALVFGGFGLVMLRRQLRSFSLMLKGDYLAPTYEKHGVRHPYMVADSAGKRARRAGEEGALALVDPASDQRQGALSQSQHASRGALGSAHQEDSSRVVFSEREVEEEVAAPHPVSVAARRGE